ncbi:MAG: ubiquinone biosynthesis protein [Halioglobus sp.]|jgi:ubiquinone biosynthesis protein
MSRISRLIKIVHIVCRYRLDEFVDTTSLPLLYRTALRLSPSRLWRAPKLERGVRLRLALEELGPVFIKFGQMLSTRPDLLPEDIAQELARLQDEVPPFSEQESVAIIERALGKSVNELFAQFENTPMASASVAQIHTATLHSGEKVVVKVVRPGIEPIICQDIALLHTLARLAHNHLPDGRRLRPVEVVSDYELTILDELDMGREAANASQLRRNFGDSKLLYVPEVYWDYSCKNVFVMERISGVAVTDMATLKAAGTDLKLLAERGVEIFFTQVFRDSFFHADMHPGNIFVDITDPADPTYIAVDCAIIGSLSDSDQYYLARVLLGIFQRDYRGVAQLHVECGWVPSDTRVHDFESAMRAVCEPIFERPISEISFGQLLVYLFRTARRFDMEVQPSLVLLQKTLLNIEGLGRQLYPDLNLWNTAQPFLEQWVKERYSPQGVFKQIQRYAPSWLEQLPQLPDAILESLQSTRRTHPSSAAPNPVANNSTRREEPKKRSRKRLFGAIIVLGCAITTALPGGWEQLAVIPPLAWILTASGVALLLARD